jgi:hypothetical protein
VHCGVFTVRNAEAPFFLLGWDRYGFQKKCVETPYAKLVFLHPVESAGHVVDYCASRARNIYVLFFLLGWDRYEFHKKHVGRAYAEVVFLHSVGEAGHVVHSGASGP